MATILKKIVVKNVGVLKAFDTPNSPRLAQLTTIYARNGRGKTTLSTVLRSAATGNPAPLLGRKTLGSDAAEPEVTLVLEAGSVRFANGKWSQSSMPVEVFDAAFIADNLYAGEAIDLEHDRGLFTVILGHAGVKLAKHQEFFNAAAKKAALNLKTADAALNDDLPTDMSREEFFAFAPTTNLDEQVGQAQKDLKAVQQADRLARLKTLEILPIPSLVYNRTLLERTLENIETSARDQLAAHFSKFRLGKQGEAWIRFGLEHVHEDNCPFCGKSNVDELGVITLYGQIFSTEYQAHFEAIKNAADAIEQAVGIDAVTHITKIVSTNADAIRSLSDFYNLDTVTIPNIDDAISQVTSAHKILKSIFDAKRQTPLVSLTDHTNGIEAEKILLDAAASLNEYNRAIQSIDAIIKARSSVPLGTEQQMNVRLANLMKRKRRTEVGVQSRIDAVLRAKRGDTRAKRFRTDVQARLKTANESAAGHYHAKVNAYLASFGASFRISEISNAMTGNVGSVDYGLIVRGHAVGRGRGKASDDKPTFKNTLSTGDKTTLAFAFFLAGLDRLSGLENRVVVFDDPLSSHDTHRQSKTIDLLTGLCGRCAQIIVLSHDAHFLRLVSKRCSSYEQVCYEIAYDGAENWSKASPADLDELCQTDDALQLNTLRAYWERREGRPSDVAPAVRKVLETHYRRSYRAWFKSTENLGPIIRLIQEHGAAHPCWEHVAALEACNVGTMGEHHGDDPDIAASSPIDPDNLHSIVGECLALVNAIRRDAPVATSALAG